MRPPWKVGQWVTCPCYPSSFGRINLVADGWCRVVWLGAKVLTQFDTLSVHYIPATEETVLRACLAGEILSNKEPGP